jgi:hypothetical protein
MLDCSGAKQLKRNMLKVLQSNGSRSSSRDAGGRAGGGAAAGKLQEAKGLGSRGSRQQQLLQQAQPVGAAVNAWPAAAAAYDDQSAEDLQELELFDWELQLHGTVHVHGSSSSSSVLGGSSSLQRRHSSSSKVAVHGSSQAEGTRRAGWWQQLWQQRRQRISTS